MVELAPPDEPLPIAITLFIGLVEVLLIARACVPSIIDSDAYTLVDVTLPAPVPILTLLSPIILLPVLEPIPILPTPFVSLPAT